MNNPTTIKELLSWAFEELKQSSDSAKLDSKILFRFISGYSDVDLIIKADQKVSDNLVEFYLDVISQRKQGTPVAYITGQKEFWSLNFKVSTDTLIPRPETELLVETALNFIPNDISLDILDLGTGTGAIACAIASERLKANVIASDESSAALDVARENSVTHKLKNISFIESNWFKKLQGKQFDLIVSNPPYVASEDKNLIDGDVRFEPDLALTSGTDGLKDLRHIIKQSKYHLKSGGYLLVEHGYDQQEDVRQLFLQNANSDPSYKNIVCLKDLNNQPRVTYGQSH